VAGRLKGRLSRMKELGLVKASDLSAPAGESARTAGRGTASGRGTSAPGRTPAGRPAARVGAGTRAEPPGFLAGWERVGELAWSRTIRRGLSLPESIDASPFARISARAGASGRPSRAPIGPPLGLVESGRLRFFDFETTGLSGGTGTVAFLAAVARSDGDGLSVRQLFLEDYPGEPAFLEALLGEFDGESVIVTYNGTSFDMPLLRTRCVMNGMSAPARPHVDALYAARRLWRRVHGGAALGLLEREVLGVEREEDVPGAMIPGLYFSYLRAGDEPLMSLLMSHNVEDVASLARLAARADSIFADPSAHEGSTAVDRAGLGRSLIAVGREAEGEELLEAALGDGDETAGLLLSRRYGRAGRVEERGRILAMLPDTYRSDIERAKHLEHAARDLEGALKWAERAARAASAEKEEAATIARIERLRRKIDSAR
jgi:uncharacterized protein